MAIPCITCLSSGSLLHSTQATIQAGLCSDCMHYGIVKPCWPIPLRPYSSIQKTHGPGGAGDLECKGEMSSSWNDAPKKRFNKSYSSCL
jgi:hypothetical protein